MGQMTEMSQRMKTVWV